MRLLSDVIRLGDFRDDLQVAEFIAECYDVEETILEISSSIDNPRVVHGQRLDVVEGALDHWHTFAERPPAAYRHCPATATLRRFESSFVRSIERTLHCHQSPDLKLREVCTIATNAFDNVTTLKQQLQAHIS